MLRVLDGKQRLACASCAARAAREAALKQKTSKSPPLSKGPSGIALLSLTSLCIAENAPDTGPVLLDYLLTEVVARGGGECEGLFRLSVSGATLAEHAAKLNATPTPGKYDVQKKRKMSLFALTFCAGWANGRASCWCAAETMASGHA